MDKELVENLGFSIEVVKESMASALEARNQFREGIGTIRNYIKKLKAERDHILSIAVTEETALARFEEWLTHMREAYGYKHVKAERFSLRDPGRLPLDDVAGFLIQMLDDDIMASMRKRMKAFYQDIESISGEDRALRLGDVNRRLMEAELAEESLIRSAFGTGMNVPRRADADPKAVMAADSALP